MERVIKIEIEEDDYNDEINKFQHTSVFALQDYPKVRLLGAGGFSQVYLVRHATTGVRYAAKEQKWLGSDKQRCLKMAREETQILKKLKSQQVS